MVTAVAGVAAAHRAQQQIHDLDMALAGRRTKGRAAVKVALVEVQRYRCLMCREEPYAFDVALPRGGLQCRRDRKRDEKEEREESEERDEREEREVEPQCELRCHRC
jgi:hypothetical protein